MASVTSNTTGHHINLDKVTVTKSGTSTFTGADGASLITLNTAGTFVDRNIDVPKIEVEVAEGSVTPSCTKVSNGSASNTTNMATSESETDYYVTLSTTAGSAKGVATITAGYVGAETKNSSNTSVPVNGNGTKTYIKPVSYSAEVSDPTAYTDISSSAPALISGSYLFIDAGYSPKSKISLAKLVPDRASIVAAGSGKIYKDTTVYDNDGNLITGTMDDAVLGVSASSVTASISSVTPTYNTTSKKFDVTGTGTISGTISASTTTTGYAVAGTTKASGSIPAGSSASISATLDTISVKATKGTDGKVTPVVGYKTGSLSGKTAISIDSGATVDKYYIAVGTDAITASTTVTPGVQSAGYGTTANYTSAGNVTVTRGANASSVLNIPIKSGSHAASTTVLEKTKAQCTPKITTSGITISNSSYSKTGITTTKPTATGAVYVTITPTASTTAGSAKATPSCTATEGWIESGTVTGTETSGSVGVTTNNPSATEVCYIPVYTGLYSVG